MYSANAVHTRYATWLAAVGLVGFLSSAALCAQAPSAPAGKVGVVNVRQAIASTAEGKQAFARFQAQFTPRQNEIQSLNQQISDLRKKLDACQSTCSDEEKARLTSQGNRLTRQLQRKQTEMQQDANAAQADIVDSLGRKMMDVLNRYARDHGFAVVFDSSAQDSPILYASSNIDITQEIIKLYDQAYPVKTTTSPPATKSAPAKPAPAKPVAPPASKP